IRDLLAETTAIEGHAPIGEHKMAHLAVGAKDWDGILVRDGVRLIGYAHLRWNPVGSDPRVAVELVVHPAHRDRGVQAALLDATRATVARSGGGRLFLWVHRVEDARDTLAHRMGFEIQRELAFMRRPARPAPKVGTLPPGVTVRTYDGPQDDEAFLEINNAAFPDHPENGGWDVAEFAARRDLAWFDPDGLFLAFDEQGKPMGVHWTKWHTHEGKTVPHGPLGEVYVLAVHPRAQGTGLGRLLLRLGMRHLAARSDSIVLYVDCAADGPVALYRSEGFEVAYREVCYVAEVPPAQAAPRALLRPAG
ncbi:MAG TPA: mycothiol synthase, partial [Euzebya sp.]|nr:mycothiol synthase [Euzebya sp.]